MGRQKSETSYASAVKIESNATNTREMEIIQKGAIAIRLGESENKEDNVRTSAYCVRKSGRQEGTTHREAVTFEV